MYELFLGRTLANQANSASNRLATERASQAKTDAFHAVSEMKILQHRVERLSLLNQALWELIREKANLTDADLERLAQEIDMRDGVEDGKITATPVKCPSCSRISNSKHTQCLYCGLEFQKDLFA